MTRIQENNRVHVSAYADRHSLIPDRYDIGLISHRLAGIQPHGYSFHYIEETTSTMDEAASAPEVPWVCVADYQRNGRGRRGVTRQKGWQAEKYKSILLTVSEPWDETAGDPLPSSRIPSQLFALATCVAVAEMTNNPAIAVRYPADLTVRGTSGKKLGGTLVENHGYTSKGPYRKAFGVGINVFDQAFSQTDYGTVTLQEASSTVPSRSDLVIAIVTKWSEMRHALRNFDNPQVFEKHNELWQHYAALTDMRVKITQDEAVVLEGEALQFLLGQCIMLQKKTGEIFVYDRYDVGTKIEIVT